MLYICSTLALWSWTLPCFHRLRTISNVSSGTLGWVRSLDIRRSAIRHNLRAPGDRRFLYISRCFRCENKQILIPQTPEILAEQHKEFVFALVAVLFYFLFIIVPCIQNLSVFLSMNRVMFRTVHFVTSCFF